MRWTKHGHFVALSRCKNLRRAADRREEAKRRWRQLNPGSTIATCRSLGMALAVGHHKVLKVQRLHQDCRGSFMGSIAHAALFPPREAADTWLHDRRSEDSAYMLEGPCSGSIRHLILSKRALAQAEVLTMDQALLSHEWR